jgi:hypothetical protein
MEKFMGMPSLMPAPPEIRLSSPMIDSRFGRGKLDSGPAMLCNTSWLDLRLILMVVGVAEELLGATKEDGGGGEEVDDIP